MRAGFLRPSFLSSFPLFCTAAMVTRTVLAAKEGGDEGVQLRLESAMRKPFYARSERTTLGVATKRSSHTQIPNLFHFGADSLLDPPNCPAAFDLFYETNFEQLVPMPTRVPAVLPGNRSADENWDIFFNGGSNGSEGYEGCFQQNPAKPTLKGTGPCSDPFHGSECEYFPEFAINVRFAPACCDASGCLCECIYQCATKPQITTLLESSLINHEFHGCNARAKSEEEGETWRREQCRQMEGKKEHKNKKEECKRKGLNVACVKRGACVKDVCKFCVRWECSTDSVLGRRKNISREEDFESDPWEEEEEEEEEERRRAKKRRKNRAKHKSRMKKNKGKRKSRKLHPNEEDDDYHLQEQEDNQDEEMQRKEIIRQLNSAWSELNLLDG